MGTVQSARPSTAQPTLCSTPIAQPSLCFSTSRYSACAALPSFSLLSFRYASCCSASRCVAQLLATQPAFRCSTSRWSTCTVLVATRPPDTLLSFPLLNLRCTTRPSFSLLSLCYASYGLASHCSTCASPLPQEYGFCTVVFLFSNFVFSLIVNCLWSRCSLPG
ncbi:hypothetical protein U1Q18_029784 [Sarracenia purpurea var. burkii]